MQARATKHIGIFSLYKLMPFKTFFSVVRILKLKRMKRNVSRHEFVVQNKTKKCSAGLNLCVLMGGGGSGEAHYSSFTWRLKFAGFSFTPLKSSQY